VKVAFKVTPLDVELIPNVDIIEHLLVAAIGVSD
jgi:hypothetical protein